MGERSELNRVGNGGGGRVRAGGTIARGGEEALECVLVLGG